MANMTDHVYGQILATLGTAVASDLRDLFNVSQVFSATEAGYLDGSVAGTGAASKCLVLGASSTTIPGGITFNEDSEDVDYRLESNANAQFLNIDGNACLNGQLALGAAIPTNPQAFVAVLPIANATGVTANQSYFHAQILPGGATVAPTGTAPVMATLNIHEPNLTATGTITAAATVRIVDAPTEGTTNWALWVDAGKVRVDESINIGGTAADAKLTTGIVISQGAADDNVMSFKSSDCAHGVTDLQETDTWGAILKNIAADGGVQVMGLTDVTVAANIYGISVTESTTDAPTTASIATLHLTGAIKSGTGVTALGATGNLLNVMNTTVNEFTVKGDGELYSNQSATVGTFDDYDDAQLCAALSYELGGEQGLVGAYQQELGYNRDLFKNLGILSDDDPNDPSKGGMFSITKLNMLCLCAIGQMGRQIAALAKSAGIDFHALPGGVNNPKLPSP